MVLLEILKKHKSFPYHLMVLGVINSIVYTCILMLINRLLSGSSVFAGMVPDWVVFVIAIVTSYLISTYFQSYLIKTTNKVVFKYEIDFLQKIRMTSYEDLERLGKARVFTGIQDTRVLATAPQVMMSVFNSVIIILCCLGYMFYISWMGGLMVLVLMLILFWFYFTRNKIIEKQLNRLRDIQVDYFKYLNDLLLGFKEVKMSTRRNNLLYNNYMLANRVQGLELGIKTKIRDVNNELTGNFSWYVVVGLIMYILPSVLSLNKENTTTLVVAVLYMMGPVSSIIGFIFEYTMIKIAAERITSLQKELSILPMQATDEEEENELNENGSFRNLCLHGITFQYPAKENSGTGAFQFGSVDIEIRRGETLFITGGNGSGKSTLINLLTGLYKPQSGSIHYNGIPITEDNRVAYSNKISAVFSDMYMFRENYDGFDLDDGNDVFSKYVDLMQMRDMVNRNRENNTIKPNFSKGQKKRMAMIYCLLENREIFVLDEWAAEQDPEFRKYFYTDLLPILKDKGKTVIAVTHDDHYFSCADRIVKLEYGKVAYDREHLKNTAYAHA